MIKIKNITQIKKQEISMPTNLTNRQSEDWGHQTGGMTFLSSLPQGKYARVQNINIHGSTRRRLLDLGLIQNTWVRALQRSPSGDPVAYEIRGAVIALREEEASKISVRIT